MHLRIASLVVVLALPAAALEGKWLPDQVPLLDRAMLQREGLQLPPERLWDPQRGTGLLAGAVNLNGCSGAFVSSTGLVVTNHHCVFSLIAEHARPDRDLLTTGFLARSADEELPGKASRLRIPKAFVDVTARVHAAIPPDADDVARFAAVDRALKEIVQECEARPAMRCDVATFFGGLRFVLMEQIELRDVRLVYAPPRAIGEFGGEVDNWMWPRHTGDFAIVRAYTAPGGAPASTSNENVPLQPEFFFPLSKSGVAPGDFVMVLGYPGATVREQLAEEMELRAERWFPAIASWSAELIALLEAVDDPAGKIAVAGQLKGLYNRRKNAEGQIDGIRRGRLIQKKRDADASVLAFAQRDAQRAGALAARQGLLDELAKRTAAFDRELLLSQARGHSRALMMAIQVARMQSEQQKPDLARDPLYMERERPRLLDQLEREQKNLFVPVDKQMLRAWVKRALALPEGQRIPAVDALFGPSGGKSAADATLANKIDALFAKTKVTSLDERKKMVAETPAQLAARKDPLLALALALNVELDAQKKEDDRRGGAALRLRPPWLEAVLAHAGRPVAPDANGTLRVAFAKVKGYMPRDGVWYQSQTTLRGLLAKHTGAEPFVVPDKVSRAAADAGAWRDRQLGDVPVCFLADADTTGGNSGSPVVDGQGRLVGVNFDRVWENVANDFGYNPDIARNVSVDVRYLLWMLDRVEGADGLLRELGVAP